MKEASLIEAVRLATRGENAAALALLEAAGFDPADEPAVRALQSDLLERLDRWGDSWAVLAGALAVHRDHPGLALRAGVSSFHRGDLEAARQWLRLAFERGALAEAAFRLGELARLQAHEDADHWWALAAASEGSGGEWRRRAEERLAAGSRP